MTERDEGLKELQGKLRALALESGGEFARAEAERQDLEDAIGLLERKLIELAAILDPTNTGIDLIEAARRLRAKVARLEKLEAKAGTEPGGGFDEE